MQVRTRTHKLNTHTHTHTHTHTRTHTDTQARAPTHRQARAHNARPAVRRVHAVLAQLLQLEPQRLVEPAHGPLGRRVVGQPRHLPRVPASHEVRAQAHDTTHPRERARAGDGDDVAVVALQLRACVSLRHSLTHSTTRSRMHAHSHSISRSHTLERAHAHMHTRTHKQANKQTNKKEHRHTHTHT